MSAEKIASRAPHALDLSCRPRRNRQAEWARRLVRETQLDVADLILPLFLIEGREREEPIASMAGVSRLSVDRAVGAAERAAAAGIPAIALFPNIDAALRDEGGSNAFDPENLVCRACRAIKSAVPEIGVVTDVALDPYTSHGHDGLLAGEVIVNDASVAALVRQALNQARAGADVIAPSDMMDGRVGAIRAALDAEGFENVQILSYAAKYASAFYGPFRDAIGTSKTLVGDKRTYQMDPANASEAGPPLSRRDRQGRGDVRGPDLRLSGVGGICDARRSQRQRLDRRRPRDDGESPGFQARRRLGRLHLFRAARGGASESLRLRRRFLVLRACRSGAVANG
jgi:delta-aminolevulinic acid dehydratase/porphobilinogen synthase